MYTLVICRKRGPGIEASRFEGLWQSTAGPRLAALEGLLYYTRSHAFLPRYANEEPIFDLIEEFRFENKADAQPLRSLPGSTPETASHLVDPRQSLALPVDVHVIKDRPSESAFKSFLFANRRPDLEPEAYRHYWRFVHGPIAARIAAMRGYLQYHVTPEAYETGEPAYDGLVVSYFATFDDIKKAVQSPEYERTMADEPNFLKPGIVQPSLIATETVVLDHLPRVH